MVLTVVGSSVERRGRGTGGFETRVGSRTVAEDGNEERFASTLAALETGTEPEAEAALTPPKGCDCLRAKTPTVERKEPSAEYPLDWSRVGAVIPRTCEKGKRGSKNG